MGRPKDEFLWTQVDGTAARWVCKHCHGEFAGSATRIRNHLSGAGNDISGCAVVPSHIRNEALKKNTRKRRPSSSLSPLRISSSSTASAPPPEHDPPPSSSNDPDPIAKSAAEDIVRAAFMKMLMAIGLSDAIDHPTVSEFWKSARQHGVPLSLLGGNPFVMEKPLSNIKQEVYQYMLMVKESWKTTGCTMITYKLSEKKENFASGREGMDVIGFYCPKGFIFVKAPPINEANFDVEIFKYALKQHQPSLELDDLICSIEHHLTGFNEKYWLPLCETSEYLCINGRQVYGKISGMGGCTCLRLQIQVSCIELCEESKWANSLIRQAVQLHNLLLGLKEGNALLHNLLVVVKEGNALCEWYYDILAKKGEKMQKFVGEEKQFQVHLSIFLLIMRLVADVQQLNEQMRSLLGYENLEIREIVGDSQFWFEGRKLALVLTLMLRIPDIMDTLIPTSGYLEMALHKVERVLLEVNKSSCSEITTTDKAFCFWAQLKSTVRRSWVNSWSYLDPQYFRPEDSMDLLISIEQFFHLEEMEELPQLRKDIECYADVFRRFSEEIELNNFHLVKLWEQCGHDLPLLRKYAIKALSQPLTCMCNQVKKHFYQLQGADDYILRLNVRMMEEFKILGDFIYNPIDINAWEWIPAELRISKPEDA